MMYNRRHDDEGRSIMHVNEITNRLAYAQRFLGFLDAQMPGVSAASLSLVSNESWGNLAVQAQERPPSKSTISVIIALVRGREIAVEAIRGSFATPTGVRS